MPEGHSVVRRARFMRCMDRLPSRKSRTSSAARPAPNDDRGEVRRMTWETPVFVEIRMDAEVTAYQGDFGE
jgi:coenzyme PQQ precursor peptide PqqA